MKFNYTNFLLGALIFFAVLLVFLGFSCTIEGIANTTPPSTPARVSSCVKKSSSKTRALSSVKKSSSKTRASSSTPTSTSTPSSK
jgi:cytoskeletal protein RodZ